jgi:hypothetical protein
VDSAPHRCKTRDVKLLGALVLPAVIGFGLVYAATHVVGSLEAGPAASGKAIHWAGRTFATRQDLAAWLRARGATYRRWARRHPALSGRRAQGTASRNASRPAGFLSAHRGELLFGALALVAVAATALALRTRLAALRLPVRGPPRAAAAPAPGPARRQRGLRLPRAPQLRVPVATRTLAVPAVGLRALRAALDGSTMLVHRSRTELRSRPVNVRHTTATGVRMAGATARRARHAFGPAARSLSRRPMSPAALVFAHRQNVRWYVVGLLVGGGIGVLVPYIAR